MKRILLSLILIISTLTCIGQTLKPLTNCKFDDSTGKYTLTGIDTVKNVKSLMLFNRALVWISKTYKNPDAVMKSKDRDAGIIVLYGYTLDNMTKSRLELDFKDNKYKWCITDVVTVHDPRLNMPDEPAETDPLYLMNKELVMKMKCYDFITSLRNSMLVSNDNW